MKTQNNQMQEIGSYCIHTSKYRKVACRVVAHDENSVVIKIFGSGYFGVPAKSLTITTKEEAMKEFDNFIALVSLHKQPAEIYGDKLKEVHEPKQKKLIGWRTEDYTEETNNIELARNWVPNVGVLPIFEGDINTSISTTTIDTTPLY